MVDGVQHGFAHSASYANLALFILILHRNNNVQVVRRESRGVMEIFIANKCRSCDIMSNDRHRIR